MTRSLFTIVIAIASLSGADAPSVEAKAYPFDSCIISGEPLGSMGDALVQIHEGREVKFCCKGCIKSFSKDPAKYLAIIDLGAKDKAEGKQPVNPAAPKPAADEKKKSDGHPGHGHEGHGH